MKRKHRNIAVLLAQCGLLLFPYALSLAQTQKSMPHGASRYNAPQRLTEGEESMVRGAIMAGDPKQLAQLIALGASPNSQLKDGSTLLMVAAGLGKWEAVKLLVKKGAHVNVKDNHGRTALMVCIDNTRMAGMFYTRIIRFLLTQGDDVNQRDIDGDTPLLLLLDTDLCDSDAIGSSELRDPLVSTVKLLLSKGAKVNVKNKRGKTALMLATEPHKISVREPDSAPTTTLKNPVIAPEYAEVARMLRKAGAKE